MQNEAKKTVKAFALGLKHHPKGQMVDSETGKLIAREEVTILRYLPLGMTEGEVRKNPILPEALAMVQNTLVEVHYGAVAELTIENRQIVNIEILLDPLAAFCQN